MLVSEEKSVRKKPQGKGTPGRGQSTWRQGTRTHSELRRSKHTTWRWKPELVS